MFAVLPKQRLIYIIRYINLRPGISWLIFVLKKNLTLIKT